MRWCSLATALPLFAYAVYANEEAEPPEEPFVLPPLQPIASHSWRGPLDEGGRIPGFEISGNALRLPNTPDFLRLVPASPLAYGGFYTSKPLQAKEWVVEIGFRVHGAVKPTTGGSSGARKVGGRGLAFWYHKAGNPTAVTMPSDPKRQGKPAPQALPSINDPTDPSVSFFGDKSPFDGLGVTFDTAASLSVRSRSEREYWVDAGADATGVVAGLLDDGKGGHVEPKGQRPPDQSEAKYLEASLGECEATFRNAPGLVWARISHIAGKVRVDLDLTPHTTLSTAARVFSHHCFTIEGVSLPTGYHLGMSALASSASEPDAVDVYAFETWEVARDSGDDAYGKRATSDARTGDAAMTKLDGTTDDEPFESGLTHELFLSQAKIMEAIDALARRVEDLSNEVSKSSGTSLQARLSAMDRKLTALTGAEPQSDAQGELGQRQSPGPGVAEREKQGLAYLANAVHGVMADVKQLSGRFDGTQGRLAGNLATIQTRIGETFGLVLKTSQLLEVEAGERAAREARAAASNSGALPYIAFILVGFVVLFGLFVGVKTFVLGHSRDRSGGNGGLLGLGGGRRGGKKMI